MTQADAIKVLYLIQAPLVDNPYGHLKDCLLRMYALTDYVQYEAISSLPLSGNVLLKMLTVDVEDATCQPQGLFLPA